MDFSQYDDDDVGDREEDSVSRRPRRGCGCGCLRFLLAIMLLPLLVITVAVIALPPMLNSMGEGTRAKFIRSVNARIAPAKIQCKSWSLGWFDPLRLKEFKYENPETGFVFDVRELALSHGLIKSFPAGKWNLGTITAERPRFVFSPPAKSGRRPPASGGFFFLPVYDVTGKLVLRHGEVAVNNTSGDALHLHRFQGSVFIPSLYDSLSMALTFSPENSGREAEVNIQAGWKSGGIKIDELKINSPWITATGSGRLALDGMSIPDNALSLSAKVDAMAISRDFRSVFPVLPRMVGNVEFELTARQFPTKAAVEGEVEFNDFVISPSGSKTYSAIQAAKCKYDFSIPIRNGGFLSEIRDLSCALAFDDGSAATKVERWSFAEKHPLIAGGKCEIKGETGALLRLFGCWIAPDVAKTVKTITENIDAVASFECDGKGTTIVSGRFQPLRYNGLYAAATDFRVVGKNESAACDLLSNINGGKIHLNPVITKKGDCYTIRSAGKIRAVEKARLTQEMADSWMARVNPFFRGCRIENGYLSVDVISFSSGGGKRPKDYSIVADLTFEKLALLMSPRFDPILQNLKINDRRFVVEKLSTRLTVRQGKISISRIPFVFGGYKFAVSGESTLAGELDYTMEFEITENMLKSNNLSFLAPLFAGKMLPLKITGTVEKPEIKVNSLIDGLKNIFNIPDGEK